MDFGKLLEKKKAEAKPMSDLHKKSKMSMLQSLRDEMGGMMSEDLKPGHEMKSVEVAAPDEAGLSEGLDKAKELVAGEPVEASQEGDEGESKDYDSKVQMEMEKYQGDPSMENLDALIECLQEKKMQMAG